MKPDYEVGGLRFFLGGYSAAVEAAIKKAGAEQLVERIWDGDHRLWKPAPEEISNRLGWLDIAARMRAEIPALQDFAKSVRADGIERVLLLGMGGSSLAPELFSKFFVGNGLPLSVLDSTDPDAVLEKANAHDPARTLYIVSSKSGGTVETASFFTYFYNAAVEKLGAKKAGKHFAAITDPGSGLEKTGSQFEFRQIFLADPNIGGRYSALSHFGLVPAALVGLDLDRLLSRAEGMAQLCREPQIEKNPGALLGLALGALALQGRDKATFLLRDERSSFGDWVEQLIAESTGKEGKGILPVTGEAEMPGADRVFIAVEDKSATPSVQLEWNEAYNVGAQFFLWEFATAVAGVVLGINPFDQPNVEAAKVQARSLVERYKETGSLPSAESEPLNWANLDKFLADKKDGDYIAIQVYAAPSSDLTEAIQLLRKHLWVSTKLASTFGYGPRFLHSTGQLHKGDGGNGLFLQFVTPPPNKDVPIPNEAGKPESDISFGVLKAAQALGDAQALRDAGRRVITFQVEDDAAAAIAKLAAEAANQNE